MVLFYVINFLLLVSLSYTEDCHNGATDIKPYLGSKTPYRFLVNDIPETDTFHGCHPERIIGFIRHGTRTPGVKLINKMKYDLPKLKGRIFNALKRKALEPGLLCFKEAEKLSSWEVKVDNAEKWLMHEGEDEMLDLAARLKKRFPTILTQPYSNASYYFKHTATQRTQESARFFTIGLFGRYKTDLIDFPKALSEDPILRFYKGCEMWKKTVKKNPRAVAEHFEFILSDETLKTCEDVSRRLGLDYVLNYEDVHAIYSTCSFETAWFKTRSSPWCSVFTESDLEVFSYLGDLKHYLIDGYGHELNYKIACPAIKHIFSYLESDSAANASAVFYFTHSGTILKLLSHLGLYRDSVKLTSSLTKDERIQRKWKTSYIDAFGSNLIFVAYKCGGETKVLTLHQEKAVQIPGCPKEGLCPLSKLLGSFKENIDNCNMTGMCSLPS